MKKSAFLILFSVLVMLFFSIISVSAQEINVDNLDNEQLTTLLLQILDKLRQEEEPEAETQVTPAPTAAPVRAAESETIEEVIQITIYDNKKLIIEALPGYMFIQPTQEPIPEISVGDEEPTIYTEPTFGKPCAPAIGGYIYWGYCGHRTVLSCGCG